MKILVRLLIVFVLCISITAVPCLAKNFSSANAFEIKVNNPGRTDVLLYAQEDVLQQASDDEIEDEDIEYLEEDDELDGIADPLEPVNRAFFYFNDKLYFWVLKPAAKGYSAAVPEEIRISIRNVFKNLAAPVRMANSLLQLKFKSAGNELLRFGINSTFGMLGLYDVAKDEMGIRMHDEDFGQTLGVWGVGPGIYITWPLLGPSTLRDTIGDAGDYFLDPVNYVNPLIDRYAVKGGDRINRTSLSLGDYEEIKKDALDPYDAVKDIYNQYRKSRIEK
ncbi:MAG TPA: VacJ family lipoprotein [Nitrospirae bacterium]|nr:putative phospholipid-binding lipoprotein MlaA precursor [bacterium BMS3Abin06]HDH12869.1 VacJ family lipoprotein [Nitrospirota bacterium]HDZ00477.1 VacJ family lipoprotein [Nitrospirota bacterium]